MDVRLTLLFLNKTNELTIIRKTNIEFRFVISYHFKLFSQILLLRLFVELDARSFKKKRVGVFYDHTNPESKNFEAIFITRFCLI